MELLERAILEKGKVLPGDVLKVGSFLNNQVDVKFLYELGKEVYKHYIDKGVNKILTVEASGIAMACLTALQFGCNVVFAKKSKSSNVSGDVFSAECYSYTHNKTNTLIVPKEYLSKGDRVLIIDDFLANGGAMNALIELVNAAGAEVVGLSAFIEKGFQKGGDKLREQGYDVFSLAIIEEMREGEIVFRK